MQPELTIHVILTSPLPFSAGPTVDRPLQRLFVKHFLANMLLLRHHLARSGLGKVRAHRAFVADHTFITTKAPYKNKTTRNQYLVRRFGYRITASIRLEGPIVAWDFETLEMLSELRAMIGSLDFVHASVAFSAVGLRAPLSVLTAKPKNGRVTLSIR